MTFPPSPGLIRHPDRHGPFRHDSNRWQVAVLDHQASSCEPCHSWNLLQWHRLGERAKYLEGMYSLFAGALSRKT